MTLDILIPCKGFARGKARLAPALSPPEREALCRHFFDRTLSAALALRGAGRVAIVSDDAQVLGLGEGSGTLSIVDPGQGLNAALRLANSALCATRRSNDLLILPTDLPLATTEALEQMLVYGPAAAIAPDLHGRGTNLLRLDRKARHDFPFAYGPESFAGHVDIAAERGLSLSIVQDERLGFDVDEPADLAAWSEGAAYRLTGRLPVTR